MKHSLAFPISDISQVGDARRVAAGLTIELGVAEHERGLVALIITELGKNLAKYAKGGQLVLRAMNDPERAGVEILSLDSGPGITDPGKWMADGYSSGGTPGTGLGAVKRQSSEFDMYSAPGMGTAIVSRVYSAPHKARKRPHRLDFGVVCIPMKGEEVCGDAWAVYRDDTRALIMVVDGLGHGAIAWEAAGEALRTFGKFHDLPALDILVEADLALRSTRGAVMAVAETRIKDRAVSFGGVGNISARFVTCERSQHMISVNGTVGVAAKPKMFQYTWPPEGIMVLTSDGLQTRWQLDNFPGLQKRHPSLIAGVLYQHYYRGRDDVTVFAARLRAAEK